MPLESLLLRLPRETDVTPELTQHLLSALSQATLRRQGIKEFFFYRQTVLALEIVVRDQEISFFITCSKELVDFIQDQLQSHYPLISIEKTTDPLLATDNLHVVKLKQKNLTCYPILTFTHFKDIDPLSSVLSIMARAQPEEVLFSQLSLVYAGEGWHKIEQESIFSNPLIQEKLKFPCFYSSIYLAATNPERLTQLAGAYSVFSKAGSNALSLRRPLPFRSKSWLKSLKARAVPRNQVLNTQELATLWHMPGKQIQVPTINWGNSILTEPPHNLPVSQGNKDQELNFFATALFKNKETTFGIKKKDRRRHMWVIGKTGTGKSTMMANMIIDDIRKKRGLAVIDPHGDLCETLLEYIPSDRVNDVVYFNPADRDHNVTLNPLECRNDQEREVVVSGVVAVFHKLYGNSWGPRLEYNLRNALLTLSEVEGSTMLDIVRLFTEPSYRSGVVESINDTFLKRFWLREFNQLPDRLRMESIAPILNKVGQFVSSPLIRSIVASPHSSINLDNIMDENKILLVNLSQGKLGEDNASLLGAMLITKLQLSAMRRAMLPEEKRNDFYLYVDEFQNFATTSFIKILSEARKYRLNLMLANQYLSQVPNDITNAILGNVGTLATFTVGAQDAYIIERELATTFTQNELMGLNNYQVAIKLMIDDQATRPFLAQTLPLAKGKSSNRDKVIRVSRERYGRSSSSVI